MKMTRAILIICLVALAAGASAQEKSKKELKYALNEDESHYVQASFLNQIWVRYNQNNPGTTIDGYGQDNTFDIGLRRTRFILSGQLSDRLFFFVQAGQNNMTFSGPRKQQIFIHDAFGQLDLIDKKLSVGAGLSGWSGLSRYASPSVGSILTLDAPLYQQATNDVNDQFLRKYSIHAKGKLGILDYRIALSKPMTIAQTSILTSASEVSQFSAKPPRPQLQGYFMLQFRDQEGNNTPYTKGTYFGKKDVFNVGAGFIYQQDAMWYTENNGTSTVMSDLSLIALDVFYDHPINAEKGEVITGYLCFSSTDFGKNYVRNVGVMNPANGVINNQASFNGAGNAFPAIGTGSTIYGQFAYLPGKELFGEWGSAQPFFATQLSTFERLDAPMLMFEAGFNWLIDSNHTKVSLHFQDRPVFNTDSSGDLVVDNRKGMLVMQLQVAI